MSMGRASSCSGWPRATWSAVLSRTRIFPSRSNSASSAATARRPNLSWCAKIWSMKISSSPSTDSWSHLRALSHRALWRSQTAHGTAPLAQTLAVTGLSRAQLHRLTLQRHLADNGVRGATEQAQLELLPLPLLVDALGLDETSSGPTKSGRTTKPNRRRRKWWTSRCSHRKALTDWIGS